MATLKSLYSDAVTANVPSDTLPPAPPVLGLINASQDTGVTWGRSTITLNWTIPTLNERIPGEWLGSSTGGADVFETSYDPIATSPIYKLNEVTGYTVGGGSSTLSSAAVRGDLTISVASAANFAADDWLAIEEGADKEYAQIDSINSNDITLKYRLRNVASWTTSATVKEVDVTQLTLTTDFTINTATGQITLVNGQTSSGSEIALEYSVTLEDLGGFKMYRIPGTNPVASPADYTTVTGYAGVVTVDDAITAVSTQEVEVTSAAENGETWTYYLFAHDDESSPNYSYADQIYVETIPSVPDGLGKTVGDAQVILDWTAFPGGSDANTDGVNVYRDDGATFEDATCKIVNSTLIPKATTTFDDSVNNVSNRRPSGEVAYPVNGSTYAYKIESEDTTTAWTTGTKNQDSESGAAVTTAAKTA